MSVDAHIKRGEDWERIRAFLLRYHGPKEVSIETLQAVLGRSLYDDVDEQ
jgi:hypothetical protein